jgi:hypothetical protein
MTHPTDPASVMRDVLAERERQKSVEGWTLEHDDMHTNGEIADAAAFYAATSTIFREVRVPPLIGKMVQVWPWDARWWKPKDRRYDLVRAGALILAEIERLDRAAGIPLPTAQPDNRRSEAEIRAEIARLTGLIDEPRRKTYFLLLARREAMQWVLNEQDTGR